MYLYTGGKTGGHIMPLIRLIQESKQDSLFIGQINNLEDKICKEYNINFLGINGHKNKLIMGIKGYNLIRKKLKNYDIKAVISTGGYISLATILYAIRKNIPIFLIEENLKIGIFNKLVSPFCKKIFLAYDMNNKNKKMIYTGLPVRNYKKNNMECKADILVIGGSLGSKPLCKIAFELSNKYNVTLIAGNYYDAYKEIKNINIIRYSNDIYSLMEESKIIIARAGASTVYEICMINKPFICIPSLNTKGNHQIINAEYFASMKICYMANENDFEMINTYADNLLKNSQIRLNMISAQKKLFKNNSHDIIFDEIKESINGV